MKSYSSRELIQLVQERGWVFTHAEGSHHHFKHPSFRHKLSIPHPRKDFKPKTLRSIMKDAGLP